MDRRREQQRAVVEALRRLARRPRTEAEVRGQLERLEFDATLVDGAVDDLRRDGQLDDAALALHWIVVRARRLGHGPRRLRDELVARGVDQDVVARAWDRAVRDGELDPGELVAAAVRKRIGAAKGRDVRVMRRVYNALLRAGFEPDAVRAELDAQLPPSDEGGGDDDLE